MKRALLLLAIGLLAFLGACDVNDYCLNCATIDGNGGNGDGGVPDAITDATGQPDACIPNGVEVCDGLDNDCDGTPDDGVVTVGDACGVNEGVCTVGVIECHGEDGLVCSGNALQGPESCDGLDNDCDGVEDDGNPEGGARCGTDIGDCVAGVTQCTTGGILDCVGDMGTVGGVDELCDGRDNDCDGNFDEGLPSLGSCGATETGDCEFGTLECVGGGPQCVGYVGPTFEECDLPMGGNPAHDSDCDGQDHNGYDLEGDVRNCGACQTSCVGTIDHATAACSRACVGGTNAGRTCTTAGNCPGGTCSASGTCVIGNCNPGFYDIMPGGPGTATEGCEYACDFQGSQEDCNLDDDDCDGNVDEALIPPPICVTIGACAATVASCEVTGSTATWDCDYGGEVSTDGSGNIVPESDCDGFDNDCDGRVDEGDPQVFTRTSCTDTGNGVCQRTGHFVCDPADQTAAPICSLDLAVPIVDAGGAAPSAETCDGKDNDCDGLTDDNTLTISSITRATNVVTVTTSAAHTMQVGQSVLIAGVTNATFNGSFTVVATPTTTTFTYAQTAANATSSGGTANGINPTSRGALQSWIAIGNGHSIMANEASRPGAANPDPSTITPPLTVNISSIARASNVVTVTTAAAHNLVVGNTVVIAGVTNATFNGSFTVVSVPTTTTATYAQTAANATSSGGTATRPTPSGFPTGLITTYACSGATVSPWINVKQPDAETACANVGGRLCTEQEWHRACAGVIGTTYPVAEPAANNGKMVFEAEDYATLTVNSTLAASEFPTGEPGRAHTWVPDYTSGYSGVSALRASPNNSTATVANTGANVTAANAAAQSPRLDFPVTITTAGNHYVWVRMWNPSNNNNNDREVHVGISATPATATPQASLSNGTNNAWTWQRTAAINVAATGNTVVSIYMKQDGARIDEIVVTRSNSTTAPTDTTTNGNDWTFGDTYVGTTCNGEDNDGDVPPANVGDQDDVIATASKASCKSSGGVANVFDMSGNVKEWTAERVPGSNPLRGGASNNEAAGITCSNAFSLADDDFFFNNVGFRCCK